MTARAHLIPAQALQRLAQDSDQDFAVLFAHGTLVLEIYRPRGTDAQTPHARDEVYVVIAGCGHFINDGVRHAFSAGDSIFVAAGVEHRFETFSDDFATWVIFYGPQGGEHDDD